MFTGPEPVAAELFAGPLQDFLRIVLAAVGILFLTSCVLLAKRLRDAERERREAALLGMSVRAYRRTR